MSKQVLSPKRKKLLRSQKEFDDFTEEPQAVENDQDPIVSSSLTLPRMGCSLPQATLQFQKRSNSISVVSPSQERPPPIHVRTTDEIEQDYVFVYSGEEISLVCIV